MKTFIFPFIMILGFIFVKSQIVEIPDANLKNALLTYDPAIDTNTDGEIQVSEAEAVWYLYIPEANISDPTGMEAFINLRSLDLTQNNLTNINLTSLTQLTGLGLGNNQITSIDVSQNVLLISLVLNSNNLTDLDVTQNPNLELLYPSSNPGLSELDLSQNPNLKNVTILNNNFTELDFSNNPLLTHVSLSDMDNLTLINLQNGTNATLTNVWISGFLPALQCVQVDVDVVDNIPESWVYNEEINFSADCALGTNNLSELELKIYPNPVQDVLNISSPKKFEEVQIHDANGKLVSNSNQNKISLKHLPAGIYWIQIQIEGKVYHEKIIKNN
ncbi:T9SS type A sorting domain-containing protein [Moheibacter sediminis]|uniref:Por secretion system C-terminal sorting domain-containing protein n=1 Tax=Moheibacter sediminis TaxID=1434700 RepID=A0A1W2BR07_9FLAO|nr:T9SS type A sorting domain-containing protein [Moheibacter sediminis]SMC75390.1 Por secretion system C-terminal sorting domain-containing protein [Moheibacter sediminis]